jgi:hypothetical protein
MCHFTEYPMAYRIYITRSEDPENATDNPIGLDEWKLLVRDIPQLRLFEGVEALPRHIQAPQPSEGLARWSAHPRYESVWFNHDKGRVYVDGFDPYVVMRMRSLAGRLGAQVIDDDGRRY